jgi:hypothetical protein
VLLMSILARTRLSARSRPSWLPKLTYVVMLAPAVAVLCSAALNISRVASSQSLEPWQVATALHKVGIAEGSKVGYIGTGLDAYWAHLAQVRIIAEIPDAGRANFVQTSAEQKKEIATKFRELGVTSVLTKFPDVAQSGEDWQEIPGTRYFIWRLKPSPPPGGEKRPN